MEYPGDASRLNTDYFKTVLSDTKYVVTAPLRFEKKQWKTVGAVAGMTAILLVYDKDIQKWSQRNKIDKWNTEYQEDDSFKVARLVKPLGDYGQMLLPLSAFYLYGHVRDDLRARRTVLISAEALLISNLIGQAMKRAINRERPSGRGIEHDWGPSSQSTPNQSMPSGHAITAFSLATVFAGQYQHRRPFHRLRTDWPH